MKLRLTITSGTLEGQVFDLETGFMTIGRGENCTVRFDPRAERIASKQHAFIEAKSDGFYISDNQSTNGTMLNDMRVQTAKLNSGDTIQFGRNGTFATVAIETPVTAPAIPQQEFRQLEINEFQQAAAQVPQQKSFQNSVANFGLGHLEAPKPPPSNVGLYVGLAIAGLLLIPLVLVVVGIMYLSLGPVPAVLASVIAFTPAALYILPLMGLDRYDPEPFWLLVMSFAWGAVLAVIVSFVVNTLFGSVVYIGTGSGTAAGILSAVISAPVVEEASKGIGLLVLLIFFRRYFDDILDGIVYGGVIALGFATVENVLYYGEGLNRAYDQYGVSSDALVSFLFLFTLRGILSPFAHVTFTAMTGIGCGISRESHNGFVKFIMPILGYIVAVVLHGVWNGLSIIITIFLISMGLGSACETIGLGGDEIGLCGFFTVYLLLEVPLFLILIGFSYFVMRRQRRILNDMLAIDVARGLIAEEHLKTATSAFKSSTWLLSGIFSGKFLARSRYLRAIGKLGLSYWHIQRATAAQGHTGSFQQNPILRDEVLRWRDKV
ncbi:MAG TPA: PrsW family glutamic-type intramembrane protease [Pyrinomonadaceae bacterium]|nr:PrsW family glutamic-type intramembrane protease [Pyrinomonadaceae bacterium]